MDAIHRRIAAPLLTGLAVRPAGLAVDLDTLAPSRLPDVFAGAPVVVTGRYTGPASGGVEVTAGNGSFHATVPVDPGTATGVGAYWARARIRDLEDRYTVLTYGHDALEQQIVATSLAHGVLSRFTAFVAVDDREVATGQELHQVTQPVAAPSGWAAQGGALPRGSGFAPAGYAPRHDNAETLYTGGYGGAPQGGAPTFGAAPSPMPMPATAPKRAPQPPKPVTAAEFAKSRLEHLRTLAGLPVGERMALLDELAELITTELPNFEFQRTPAATVNQLRDLLVQLSTLTGEARWQRTIELLTSIAGERKRSFWKR